MYILKCNAFDGGKCCSGCHETNELINVTPHAPDSTLERKSLDWSMGIQGLVCCGKYEFVRSLSREHWIARIAAIENWSEQQIREYMTQGSWHKLFDRPKQVTKVEVKIKPKIYKTTKCPNCNSVWNEQVCEDCGWTG